MQQAVFENRSAVPTDPKFHPVRLQHWMVTLISRRKPWNTVQMMVHVHLALAWLSLTERDAKCSGGGVEREVHLVHHGECKPVTGVGVGGGAGIT